MSAQPNALADPYAAYGGQAIPAQSASDPYAAYGGKVASAGVDLSNQQGQGTYQMRNQQGQTIGVPYEQVPQAAQQGYRFAQEQDGWRYQKDHNYGTTGPGHEAEYAQSDRNAPLPMQAISGVVKGIGTIGKPVMDVVGRLGGVPQSAIDSSLQAQTPMETSGKVGMIGTALAPAAIAAPAATIRGLAGGTLGAGAGTVIGSAAGMSPENIALLQDAGGIGGGAAGAYSSLANLKAGASGLGIPTKSGGGAKLNSVMSQIGNRPVDMTNPLPPLEQAQRLSMEGHGSVGALDSLYNRMNTVNPVDFAEAKSRYEALGYLTANDKIHSTPKLQAATKMTAAGLRQDLSATAEKHGLGDLFESGMSEYRKASMMQNAASQVAQWGLRYGVPAGIAYELVRTVVPGLR